MTATVLRPMRAEVSQAYLDEAVADYADDNVAAGRWPRDGAVERSRAEFASLLPQGLTTPDNHLFEITAGEDGPSVGCLWLAVEQRHGIRSAFVYDVSVHAAQRRRGHAERAFRALEGLVAEMGLNGIGLHVFSHNPAALALYRKLGYTATSVNMHKRLGGQD